MFIRGLNKNVLLFVAAGVIMRRANLIVPALSVLAIGLFTAGPATRESLADEGKSAAQSTLTPEQKAALAVIDARLAGVESLAGKIDDPGYKAEVARQIEDLQKSRRALAKDFDPGRYETLMHSVISRYQTIGLWLKEPALPAPAPNTLTPDEAAAGWRLLFDGQSLAGWRGYRAKTVPASWRVENGSLLSRREKGMSSGDIITDEQFADFELLVDWKMTKGNNSGILYRATEEHDQVWQSGPEFQVLDNSGHLDGGHLDGLNPLASAGACYAVFPPTKNMARPLGEWNTARIVAQGKHVEHWLNGAKIVEYEVDSDVWKAHVKTSKLFETAYGRGNWGQAQRGHLGLQDYGGAIDFRTVKIRPR
jgi:hypothetical protein